MGSKLFKFVILAVLALSVTACSSDDNQDSQIAKLQKENSSLKAEIAELKANNVSESIESSAQENDLTEINIGDIISTENKEITINNVEFSYDVIPDKTDTIYSHYQADSGHVYIHIDTDIKNLQKQNLPCDEIMDVVADYNNGFTYNAFPVVEDSTTGFTYANIEAIKPLETLGMRFLIDCPQEVEESSNPIFLTFKVDGKNYKYTIR